MDVFPGGGHRRRKRLTKADIERLKEGHRKADDIRDMRETHHEEQEIPQAEEALMNDLETINKEVTPTPKGKVQGTHKKEKGIQKLKKFLHSLFS